MVREAPMNSKECNRLSRFLVALPFTWIPLLAIAFMLNLLTAASDCWSEGGSSQLQLDADLTDFRLEQLMNIEVTSVSKKAQKLSDAAAAVFVITQEDIRRSGATTIPDVLRMAPGVDVARIDGNKWAISIRGFNGRFANKLLVLMDGRTVYTPVYSGVFWDVQDTLLEDIERIEIIRGPGATLWGANAVNGVINIITKQAKDTQGALITGGYGTEEQGFSGARYGGKTNDSAFYRAYFKYFNRGDSVTAEGVDGADGWNAFQGGGRIDWDASPDNALTVQGDIYSGEAGDRLTLPTLSPPYSVSLDEDTDYSGGNVLGRWLHHFSPSSNMALQVYYDRTKREDTILDMTPDTFDVDFQHSFALGSRHHVVWGMNYRLYSDQILGSDYGDFDPESADNHLAGMFLQDEITLIENRLSCLLGSKFEYNTFPGFEIQPNARLLWTPDPRHSIWAAVSRAVRTPSRGELEGRVDEFVIPGPLPTLVSVYGNPDFGSEDLIAYEAGYRWQTVNNLSFDIAPFYNDYAELRSVEVGSPFLQESMGIPYLVLPIYPGNKMAGQTYGVEAVADWHPYQWWRLQVVYSFLQMDLYLDENSTDTTSEIDGESPSNQLSLRSLMNLPANLELDLWLRYVDDLPAQGVPAYVTMDAQLA